MPEPVHLYLPVYGRLPEKTVFLDFYRMLPEHLLARETQWSLSKTGRLQIGDKKSHNLVFQGSKHLTVMRKEWMIATIKRQRWMIAMIKIMIAMIKTATATGKPDLEGAPSGAE